MNSDSAPAPPPAQVSEEEVDQFIAKASKQPTKEATFESKALSGHDIDTAPRSPDFELPKNAALDQSYTSRAHRIDMSVAQMLKDLTVSSAELDEFTRAVLSFAPPDNLHRFTQILLGGQLQVVCRAITAYENELLYTLLENRLMNKRYFDASVARSREQQMFVALQAEVYNTQELPRILFASPGTSLEEDMNRLEQFTADKVNSMTRAQYVLCLQACQLFEMKTSILQKRAILPDFSNPAEFS